MAIYFRHGAGGAQPRIAIIGAGAFGAFMARHLAPHHDVVLSDTSPGLSVVAADLRLPAVGLAEAARCPVVILAVPVQALLAVAHAIAPLLAPGAMVIDVCSVKVVPARILRAALPADVQIICTHPLFGPATGRNGITGCNIAVANIRGRGEVLARRFLRSRLKLCVVRTTPEAHDFEAAHVQGLTHFISRTIAAMALPYFRHRTRTYDLLAEMVDVLKDDSDALYEAIMLQNPQTLAAVRAFLGSADAQLRRLELRAADPLISTAA